jgi:hypothetical protein
MSKILYLEALIQYFDQYPLLTKKKLIYVRWKRVILRREDFKMLALTSEKGMRRFRNLFASVGKIRQAQNIDVNV